MKLFKLVALNFVCIVVANRCAFAESMDARFEERYAAWKAWIATNEFRSTYTACKEYYDIVALGVPAVPLIMGKIEKNAEDFHLSSAIKIMTRRRFDKTEWPVEKLGDSKTAAKLYVHWWRVGRFQTGTRFYELYARWSKFNIERELGEADRVYKQIVNLGIPVLPYLIEIIDKSPEFVAAVSILSGDALPKNASLEETKTWWEKNKEQFTLPPAVVINMNEFKVSEKEFKAYLDSTGLGAMMSNDKGELIGGLFWNDAAWIMWQKNIFLPTNDFDRAEWQWSTNVVAGNLQMQECESKAPFFDIFFAGDVIAKGEVKQYESCRKQKEAFLNKYSGPANSSRSPLFSFSLVQRLDVSYLGAETNMLYITERGSLEDSLTYKNITLKIRYKDDSLSKHRKAIAEALMTAGAVTKPKASKVSVTIKTDENN